MYLVQRVIPEIVYSVALTAGIAAREFTFQSPNYPTRFSHMDSAADAADSTDKPTWTFDVAGTVIATGSAITAADTVNHVTAVDAGKSEIIPAGSKIKLILATAGTAGNVLGLTCRVVLHGTN